MRTPLQEYIRSDGGSFRDWVIDGERVVFNDFCTGIAHALRSLSNLVPALMRVLLKRSITSW